MNDEKMPLYQIIKDRSLPKDLLTNNINTFGDVLQLYVKTYASVAMAGEALGYGSEFKVKGLSIEIDEKIIDFELTFTVNTKQGGK